MSENNTYKISRSEAESAVVELRGLVEMFTGWAVSIDEGHKNDIVITTFLMHSTDLLNKLMNYFDE